MHNATYAISKFGFCIYWEEKEDIHTLINWYMTMVISMLIIDIIVKPRNVWLGYCLKCFTDSIIPTVHFSRINVNKNKIFLCVRMSSLKSSN